VRQVDASDLNLSCYRRFMDFAGQSRTNDPVADAAGDFHEISRYVLPGCRSRQGLWNSVRVSYAAAVVRRYGMVILNKASCKLWD